MQDFHRVIGKAVLDENFRAQLFSNPNAALQGFNLSPQEIQTLQNMSPEQFNALAQQFGQQLPGASDLVKAKIEFVQPGGSEGAAVDYFYKEQGSPDAAVDYFKKATPDSVKSADLVKGDLNFNKLMPGGAQSGPSPHMFTGGVRLLGQLFGAGLIIVVLIGLLLVGAPQGAFETLSLNFTCPAPGSTGELLPAIQEAGDGSALPSDVQMGDGSVMPAGGVAVAVGDVNGDMPSGGPGGQIDIHSFSWGELESFSWGELTSGGEMFDITDGTLQFFNILRIKMGGQPFIPMCGELPEPTTGEMVEEGDGSDTGGTTGGQSTGGSSTGGQPEAVTAPDSGLCAQNGGIQWQGTACICPGLVDNVTVCNDGTKLDQMTEQTCTPEQACDQQPADPGSPTNPQNPPAACACSYICVDQTMTAVAAQCGKYEWRDCTGAACNPQQTP